MTEDEFDKLPAAEGLRAAGILPSDIIPCPNAAGGGVFANDAARQRLNDFLNRPENVAGLTDAMTPDPELDTERTVGLRRELVELYRKAETRGLIEESD
jgi:hypothetical protein